MAEKRTAKYPTHWSYSAWSTWKGCAYKFYCGYVLGVREPPNKAMERGIQVHKAAEDYLTRQKDTLPPLFKPFKTAMKELRAVKPVVEEFWGVNPSFEFHHGSATDKSWCVMKMDAAVPPKKLNNWAYVLDFKTGREYDGHAKQGELYSCITLAKYPKAEGVIAEFYYLDQGYPTQVIYPAKLLRKKMNFWIEQGTLLLDKKQKYLPTPNEWGCKYCFHRSDKGGDCKAWKKVER